MSDASIPRAEETADLSEDVSKEDTPDMVNDTATFSKALVAIAVGCIVSNASEGCDEGRLEGLPLGVLDGCKIGCIERPGVGRGDGEGEGSELGSRVGSALGKYEGIGLGGTVGTLVGANVGIFVGCGLGLHTASAVGAVRRGLPLKQLAKQANLALFWMLIEHVDGKLQSEAGT